MRLIFLSIALITLAPLQLHADFICGAEVSYKFERGNGEKGGDNKEGEKTAEETFFSKVHKKGATEEATKKLVAEALVAEKSKARERCRQDHENLAGCISAKYSLFAGKAAGLTFSARKTLEEAITKDCTKQQGHCLESAASETTCEEEVKPVTEGDAAKAEGGKGEKEKGGKKK